MAVAISAMWLPTGKSIASRWQRISPVTSLGGTKVTYTNPIAVARNGGWRYGYGNMFYVELVSQYLTVSQVSGELAQKIMNEALKYQGWDYVYGGSNPNTSFDCSGLVQWCYGKAGIILTENGTGTV